MTKAKHPDTKTDKEYKELREEGMDKRKAARVVNYKNENTKNSSFPDESKKNKEEEE